MKPGSLKRLLWPTIAIAVMLPPCGIWLNEYRDAEDLVLKVVSHIAGFALVLSAAWFLVRVIEVFVWGIAERRTGSTIPRLIKDLVGAVLFLATGLIVAGAVFDYPVAGIWTATGLVGLVIGFALRNMIADIFSGIALNIDQPFKIGDWVKVYPRSVDPMYGEVIEISWRSTRILKTDNTVMIVPNSLISSIIVTNLSAPTTINRFNLSFILEFGFDTQRALRVLLAGARSTRCVERNPEPKVLLNGATHYGVEYRVRYWIDVSRTSPRRARHEVTLKILEHLHHAGITLAYKKQDLYLSRMPNRALDSATDRASLLGRVELFAGLEKNEIDRLARHMHEVRFTAGQSVVKKGDAGDSMYIVVEGLLGVHSERNETSHGTRVGQIEAGSFFGEMSLLTGESRAATVIAETDAVVFEIRKDAIGRLLEDRPEIAIHVSEVVADRRAALLRENDDSGAHPTELKETLADQLLERMKGFFSSLRISLKR